MSCPDHETLVAFVDGELEAGERAAVEHHLGGCPSCQEFAEEMRALNTAGRSSIRAIRTPVTRPRMPMPSFRLAPRAALAAAAMILIVLGITAWLLIPGRNAALVDVAHKPSPPPTTMTENHQRVTPLFDEEFERWAAPYRQLQIPLVPMEEVANYNPSPILPFTAGLDHEHEM